MSTGMLGILIGVIFILAQVVLFWALGKLLSVLNDRFLPEQS
ncbi:MAG: hypothetical protein SOT58_09660 [Agathobacter sp.]|nr:hypothetical protein [Lachnobacterium sp.]MDY2912293.1 hypothetical protein [Agathobacter sp.]